jgi:hypothetical protein
MDDGLALPPFGKHGRDAVKRNGSQFVAFNEP